MALKLYGKLHKAFSTQSQGLTQTASQIEAAKLQYQKPDLSLFEFFQQAWQVLEPGTPLLLNWHQELICEYLTLITEGKLTRLIINIPPRYSKSYLASVCWPVWEWTFKPWTSWVFATYAQGLSTEHSTNRRTLIQSNWYQEKYGDRFQLAKDENLKTQFRNTSRGQMFATSFGGSLTGFGGDRICCLPGNTNITTRAGTVEIEQLVEEKLPLLVATFNHDTQEVEHFFVDRFEKRTEEYFVQINCGECQLECTREHPVWTAGIGYVSAMNLRQGDSLLIHIQEPDSLDSYLVQRKILSVTTIKKEKRPVYNIATRNHNYFAGNILVHNCDDPHNPKQALSEKQRETAITTFKQTISTRLNDKKTGAIALIMQRLHTNDLSGFLLGLNEYTHLCIQGEAPTQQTFTFPISGKVITREPGEPLHAEREGLAELAIAKKNLGEYGFAGQYQQTPSPLGGGLIKRHWWRTWDYLPRTWDNQCISVDAAFKGNANSDFVVIQCWGKKGPKYYLLDQIRDRMTFTETEIQLVTMINRWPEARARIIEDKANGPAIIDRMSRMTEGIIPWNPGTDSKVSRITALAPLIEGQNILLPKTDWTDGFLEEASAFPYGANDDQLDAMVIALTYLETKTYDHSWLNNL